MKLSAFITVDEKPLCSVYEVWVYDLTEPPTPQATGSPGHVPIAVLRGARQAQFLTRSASRSNLRVTARRTKTI